MISVTVNRSRRIPISDVFIKRVVLESSRLEKKIRGSVSITLLGEVRMRRLNKQYRNVDRSTDVLSFPWFEHGASRTGATASDFIGDIFLSYQYITRQAQRFHVPVREEFTRMLVHGLLHVVGYDHVGTRDAKRMFSVQEKIVWRCINKSI